MPCAGSPASVTVRWPGRLARVVADVNTGLPLAESFDALAGGIRLPALSRCVEQITGALERGTPLAEVLRAQAQDCRDDAKRELLEVAGKKEVAMSCRSCS